MNQDEQIVIALRQFIAETTILSPAGEYMRSAYDSVPLALRVFQAQEALRKITGEEGAA